HRVWRGQARLPGAASSRAERRRRSPRGAGADEARADHPLAHDDPVRPADHDSYAGRQELHEAVHWTRVHVGLRRTDATDSRCRSGPADTGRAVRGHHGGVPGPRHAEARGRAHPAHASTGVAFPPADRGDDMPGKVRRIVTGVNAAGRSTILSDMLFPLGPVAPGESVRVGLWTTDSAPASNEGTRDPVPDGVITRTPPDHRGGTVVRITDIPPDTAHAYDPENLRRRG